MASLTLNYIKQVVDRLPVDDQLDLIEHVAKKLREKQQLDGATGQAEQRVPQDLYGIWRDKVPPDVDIDALLYEIRHEWEEELDEVTEP